MDELEGFAAMVGDREYGDETDMDVRASAKDKGIVIMYGASDDLVEFDGAISEELDFTSGSGIAYVFNAGASEDPVEGALEVAVEFNRDGWVFGEMPIENARRRVTEAGEVVGQIVFFRLEDLPKIKVN